MTNKSYAAGRRAEYKLMKHLREEGFQCVRTAGSHGPFDVVAWNGDECFFIQVKKANSIATARRAIREANSRFRLHPVPSSPHHHLETWLLRAGTWHIYPYHGINYERISK